MAALRSDLRQEIALTRTALQRELDVTRAEASGLILDASQRLDARLAQALGQVDPVLEETRLLLADSRQLVGTYQAIPDRVAWANRWLWDCQNYSGCLQSQTLALVGSARYTMGQVAKAAPDIVHSMDRLADSSGRAAENLSVSAANLAQMTAPGPKWVRRIGIAGAVALPFAQISTPFVLWRLNAGQKPVAAADPIR